MAEDEKFFQATRRGAHREKPSRWATYAAPTLAGLAVLVVVGVVTWMVVKFW